MNGQTASTPRIFGTEVERPCRKGLEDLNFRTCCDWVKFLADEFSLLDVVVDLVFEFLKLVAEARTWWRAVGRGFGHRGTVEAGVGAGEETAHRGARTG